MKTKKLLNTSKNKRFLWVSHSPPTETGEMLLTMLICICFTKTRNFAQQPDCADFNPEIELVHLTNLLQTAFSIGLKISGDYVTNQLPLRGVRGPAATASRRPEGRS